MQALRLKLTIDLAAIASISNPISVVVNESCVFE